MMFYGNPEVVALEIVPAQGRFCGVRLWLAGVSVGEPELYEPAGAIAVGLAHFRRQALARIQLVLFREPAHTCLDVVYKALFVLEESDDLQSCVEQRKKYGAFLLSPNLCESLDAFLIVVVSDGNEQRILSRSYIDGAVVEAKVPDGTLEKIFLEAEEPLRALDP